MRSLLFHHELKAKRLKAIKSKDYRKRVAKVSGLIIVVQCERAIAFCSVRAVAGLDRPLMALMMSFQVHG